MSYKNKQQYFNILNLDYYKKDFQIIGNYADLIKLASVKVVRRNT